jgi:hypothetical protein
MTSGYANFTRHLPHEVLVKSIEPYFFKLFLEYAVLADSTLMRLWLQCKEYRVVTLSLEEARLQTGTEPVPET